MKVDLSSWYKFLSPRAVVLIATQDKKGNSNAAPFSFVMPASVEPPLVAFCSDPEHHTVANIRETGDFTVNVPDKKYFKSALAVWRGSHKMATQKGGDLIEVRDLFQVPC